MGRGLAVLTRLHRAASPRAALREGLALEQGVRSLGWGQSRARQAGPAGRKGGSQVPGVTANRAAVVVPQCAREDSHAAALLLLCAGPVAVPALL